jgi:hypothetical protein
VSYVLRRCGFLVDREPSVGHDRPERDRHAQWIAKRSREVRRVEIEDLVATRLHTWRIGRDLPTLDPFERGDGRSAVVTVGNVKLDPLVADRDVLGVTQGWVMVRADSAQREHLLNVGTERNPPPRRNAVQLERPRVTHGDHPQTTERRRVPIIEATARRGSQHHTLPCLPVDQLRSACLPSEENVTPALRYAESSLLHDVPCRASDDRRGAGPSHRHENQEDDGD